MEQPFKRDTIRNEVSQLEGHVLTFYLNTDPTSEEWKIRLKKGLKRTEEYQEAANTDEKKTLRKIVENVQVKVRDVQRDLKSSLICFASKDTVLLYRLNIPVENDFLWQEGPATDQLRELFDKYERTGVILLQANSVTLITAGLDGVEDEVHYEIDFDTEDWKQYKGLAYGAIISSGANHRDKFESRMRANQARWYKSITPTIRNYANKQGWKSIYLVGPGELTEGFSKQINQKITKEINLNLASKSAEHVLSRTVFAPKEE
ncbi:MAG TPA: VLRF1 family aeRF1-type release factor [Pseudogracilibacillus sp.]|nr:VLRF1 family aeRF1-type release factor [Pseudogracilibacillus sp.]